MQGVGRLISLTAQAKRRSFITVLKMLASGRVSEVRDIVKGKLARGPRAPQPAPKTLAETMLREFDGNPAGYWAAYNLMHKQGTEEDVKEFISKLSLTAFDFLRPQPYHDFTDWEKESYIHVSDLICQEPGAAITLLRAAEYVLNAGIEGDFVECGVFKGASPILMARALMRHADKDRQIYLYDTYEGMPKPTEWDVDYLGARAMDVWEKTKWDHVDGSNDVYCSIEDVQNNLKRVPFPSDRYHLVKGKVEETIPAIAPEKISLLRLDTDYYESTKHELHHLFPRLSRGGVLIIDDYGHFQGARKAVNEYFSAPENQPVFLVRVTESVRFAVKAL